MKIKDLKQALAAAEVAGFGETELVMALYIKGEMTRVRLDSVVFYQGDEGLKLMINGSVEES